MGAASRGVRRVSPRTGFRVNEAGETPALPVKAAAVRQRLTGDSGFSNRARIWPKRGCSLLFRLARDACSAERIPKELKTILHSLSKCSTERSELPGEPRAYWLSENQQIKGARIERRLLRPYELNICCYLTRAAGRDAYDLSKRHSGKPLFF